MADQKRPYRKQRRAELEQATRRSITESAVELHGTLGPSRTSLSAIAAHAGVRRSTLYRHFADEAALFAACTAHWMSANPLPDLARWAAIPDPGERLRLALAELYPHYRRTEQMMTNILRDEETMPIVAELFAGFRQDAASVARCAGAFSPRPAMRSRSRRGSHWPASRVLTTPRSPTSCAVSSPDRPRRGRPIAPGRRPERAGRSTGRASVVTDGPPRPRAALSSSDAR